MARRAWWPFVYRRLGRIARPRRPRRQPPAPRPAQHSHARNLVSRTGDGTSGRGTSRLYGTIAYHGHACLVGRMGRAGRLAGHAIFTPGHDARLAAAQAWTHW